MEKKSVKNKKDNPIPEVGDAIDAIEEVKSAVLEASAAAAGLFEEDSAEAEEVIESPAGSVADAQGELLEVDWQMASADFAEEATEVEASENLERAEGPENAEIVEASENAEETPIEVAEPEMSEADSELADAELGPAEFIEADTAVSIIESLLFVSERPISLASIKALFKGSNIRTKDISRILDMLASEYARPERGIVLEEVNGGFQLRTKVDNAEFLRRLSKGRPFKLSGPSLETLSIIAYRQPITKHEVDEIRGVESGHLIRALMERGLVNFAGKSETLPGKPMQYATTKRFLETFGLRNIKELPTLAEIDELLPDGIGAEDENENKPVLADLTEAMSEEIKGTYSEGEEELTMINETLQQIDTSSEFFEQEKIRQREKRDLDRANNIREALAVGEAVDDKDVKWLKRFEAKIAEPAMAATPSGEGGAGEAVAASEEAAGDRISEDLEELAETLAVEGNAIDPDDAELLASDDDTDSMSESDWDDDLAQVNGDGSLDDDDDSEHSV